MTATEMFKRVDDIVAAYEDEYYYLGIRFEDKARTVGEVIQDRSKSNPEREDLRDFPEYGTEEYENLPDLDGICAYNLADINRTGWTPVNWRETEDDVNDVQSRYRTDHCYILGCKRVSYGEDDNEIIMGDAKVLEIIF